MNGSVVVDSLESINASDYFAAQRHRWNTNEEIAAILIAIDKHEEWLSKEVKIRPKSGSMMLYSRKRVRYRRDGYCWKKRKDGKTTREDHMKLKVQGTECIYGCYVHSAILPTFHRRCYWLLQNPDIVLVHYLNVPYSDDNKVISPALNYFADNKKEWTKDELISELKPMFFSENEPDLNNELEKSTVETIEAIVQQLMVKQRAKVKALEDASDGGINAKALTVVNAITNSAREAKQQQHNTKSNISHNKNKQSVINKRDVATCIITTQNNNANDNSSKQLTTQGTVQLLQLASSGQTALRTTTNSNANSSQSAPTSLIFNLSQFQSGSGLLILNSPTAQSTNSRANESQQITTPLTLLYGRPPNNNSGESPPIPAVVCSSTKLIRANLPSKLQQELIANSALDNSLNNINRLNTINLFNGDNCNKINNINKLDNEIDNKADINENINSRSDSENSDENQDENKKCSIESSVNLNETGQDSVGCNDESMIINSNPSTPEHLKTSQQMNVNIISSEQSNHIEVDMNCNLLNHSQSQHSSLSHNHNYSYSHYYNNNNNNMNSNNHSININQNTNSLLNYDMDPNDLNPMDFIDNDIPTPDENLFNLDTFDILGDIDNLDDLTNTNTNPSHFRNAVSHPILNQNKSIKSESSSITSAANITDYSPEWCYPEGGIKVLVAGPWFASTYRYTILFDGVSVQTQLVQSGLLRCYSPEHEPGFVTLQVASDGVIISNSVIFEYRDHPTVPIHKTEDYFSIDENIFKFSLLERFELLESRLSQCSSKRSLTGMESTKQFSSFEERLVFMCTEMANCSWLPFDEKTLTSQSLRSGLSQTDMSLIHLTAALNYYKLMQCLLKWRLENPSIVLEIEVDAFSCDRNECTPLMWACAKGHYESAILLYRWNRAAINLCNNTGHTPLHLAREKGFHALVEEIERLEKQQSISFSFDNCDNSNSIRNSRKASLDIPTKMKTICSSTVKRGSACLHRGLSFPKLVKCFSADSSHPNLSLDSVNDQLNVDPMFLSSCISDSEDELEMSTSSTTGLSSSHRDSIGSCDIIMDCNSSEPSRVLTLAEHIIAAMPDRIKAASIASLPDEDFDDDYDDDNESSNEVETIIENDINDCDNHRIHSHNHNQLNDNFCNFSFEISDNYTYRDANTPTNSSPASSSCLHSPGSFPLDSPSPPPTAADFCEFFQASGKITKELGDLTLTDKEQRELYAAARVIQRTFRSYKGRKRQEEQNKCCDKDKERAAAILIQSYYRRYKQYMYYRQITRAAQVIQSNYRNYCEHKRFKKSINQEVFTVVDGNGQQVNSFTCNYSDCDQMQCKNSREGTPFNGLKRTYSQRRRNIAARKIQQFMRQSKNNIWDFNLHNNSITERTCISCRKRDSATRSAFTKSSNNTIC